MLLQPSMNPLLESSFTITQFPNDKTPQLSLKSIITGFDRNQLVLDPTYRIPIANQMPPTVLAMTFRLNQIRAQKANPSRGRIASRNSFRFSPVFFEITENCQKQAKFTPMKARKAPKLSNSPACS